MKKLLGIVVLGLLFTTNSYPDSDCSSCASEAWDGSRDAMRAYRSSELNDCQYYAKKAYRHLSYAESYASDCNCSEAESEAWDGYRDAKRAYRSSELNDCQYYAKKAYRHASWTEDYANGCD